MDRIRERLLKLTCRAATSDKYEMKGTNTSTRLHIGDGADWHFVNGPWRDGSDHGLVVPEETLFRDGDAMQGVHYAFHRRLCYRDCTVRFQFCLQPHTDVGVVFRAQDESHFQLVHFPSCGQACRAQNFWAAVSGMDDSGYLRVEKRELLRRVPSTIGKSLRASIRLTGSTVQVRLGDYGSFEAQISGTSQPGHIGVFLYGPAQIRDIEIDGEPASTPVWQDQLRQSKNWFHPVPAPRGTWQQPQDFKRLSNGELLLLFNSRSDQNQSETARSIPYLARSDDGGRSWSGSSPLTFAGETNTWFGARFHVTPKGRLIALLPDKPGGTIRDSNDGGVTWSAPTKTNLPLDRLSLAPHAFLNLSDGAMLAFPYGRFGAPISENVWTWGSVHCQAFCCRSEDDGRTWSSPVNIDTPLIDGKGQKVEGNLDLTEVSAVELVSGRVMAFVRPISSPWMWETWSDDGGRTWGACVRGPFPGYASPNMVRTRRGAILIAVREPELTVFCSHDEGVTWDQGTIIDTGIWAMGSLLEVEPDLVLYVYWDSFQGLMRAQFLRVVNRMVTPVRIEKVKENENFPLDVDRCDLGECQRSTAGEY